MTYKEAQEQAFKIGVKDANGPARAIIREYNIAFDSIQKELKQLYNEIKKAKITETQYYNKLRQIGRLNELSKDITDIFDTRYSKIMSSIRLNSINTMTNSYYMQQYAMSWFTPDILPYSYINRKAVDLSVWWTPKVWNQIKGTAEANLLKGYIPKWGKQGTTLQSLLLKNKQKQLRWIKSSITQGLIQGKSFTDTSKLLFESFGKSKRNAMRVVRTETIRNMNAGDFLNGETARAKGVEGTRMWSAVLDTRTRSQSAQMDGQKADVEGNFHYPNGAISRFPGGSGVPRYDINERCTSLNVLNGVEPSAVRGRDPVTGKTKLMTYRKFPEWAEQNNLIYKNGRWIKGI